MRRIILLSTIILSFFTVTNAQNAIITVNAAEGKLPVSPYIYGKNNNFSTVFGTPTTAAEISLYKEAGLRFTRENGGNNATKYNWRRKISGHPDWYNNVYSHDWDYASQTIQSNIPTMQTMWAFQLIGRVASNKNNNFNDWSYNKSQWWSGVAQNLAGGGQLNPSGGSKALVEGNPLLYTMEWPADSTVAILDHWFAAGGVGLNKDNFRYWSMDNEPEIWNGTHDDVMPVQLSASVFVDKYIEVAKKARQKFPDIKLTGPVPANEWQWYKWSNETLKINGTYYCWLEYFIKRLADEQKSSGIRLLDVLDIHWYPGETANADVVQLYRAFFDKTYVYPGANGVRTINGGWDTSQNKEYIFQRINDWLVKHFGANHGVTLGLSECDFNTANPNITSVLYASMLGTFADNGVEFFTPWGWKTGQWETLHLFSRYAKNTRVSTTSSLENYVSGYSTINAKADSMTVILVNRNLSASHTVTVNLSNFSVQNGSFATLQLSSLPASETFKSHTDNALKAGTVSITNNSFTLTLPALSTTAVILSNKSDTGVDIVDESKNSLTLFPNPAKEHFSVRYGSSHPLPSRITIYNQSGKMVNELHWENPEQKPLVVNTGNMTDGIYFVKVSNAEFSTTRKLVVLKK